MEGKALSHGTVTSEEPAEQAKGGRPTMIYLTRRAEFSASHYFHSPAFSAEENQRLFGKCNNPRGHGHNYVLEVTVRGPIDSRSGMVLDLKQLKEILHNEVIEVLDHRFLNEEVPAFRHLIPTTENLAVEIWRMLAPQLESCELHRIRLYETPDLFVDYFGPAEAEPAGAQSFAKD
jgi:6-pyruvoyltetrahydropterin/6-carboxytetrahydropterin synthase